MTVRPIIFSTPMVKALRKGAKTQTRRLATSPLAKCRVGDMLYVRESFGERTVHGRNLVRGIAVEQEADTVIFRADGDDGGTYRPGIHMPRAISRLTLAVTEIRAQFLHEISNEDIGAEGLTPGARLSYISLWNSLHGEGAWNDNPPIIALTFEVHHCNVDLLLAA